MSRAVGARQAQKAAATQSFPLRSQASTASGSESSAAPASYMLGSRGRIKRKLWLDTAASIFKIIYKDGAAH